MKTYPIYFWPRGSLASPLYSDTIFGAVCWAVRLLKLRTDVGDLLANFSPPLFAFSSLFPVYGRAGERLRFYPRPLWLGLGLEVVTHLVAAERQKQPHLSRKRALVTVTQNAKRLADLAYLSEQLFGEVLAGRLTAAGFYEGLLSPQPDDRQIKQIEVAALTRAERRAVRPAGPFAEWFAPAGIVQHNHIDRVAGATVDGLLFYENETFFHPQAGLWCALRTTPETLEALIRPALRYLSDTGLGANRTAGKGHFQIEVGEAITLPAAGPDANGLVILSRYLPQAGEWSTGQRPLAYQLETVTAKREKKFAQAASGQQAAPLYKRQLRMLTPGSVVPYPARPDAPPDVEIYGRLAEVVPGDGQSHTVYQSGLALCLPARVPDTPLEAH